MRLTKEIQLIISLYPMEPSDRANEIAYSLQKNLSNQYFDKIIILDEGYAFDFELPEYCQVVPIANRPTFNDLFDYCEEGKINVIANNDIWFDHTVKRLKWMVTNIDALCLTRREPEGILFMAQTGASQDVWVFKGIPRIENREATQFFMGVKGCDNRIAFEIYANGYVVTNPAKLINAHHEHQSNERDFRKRKRLVGAFLYVRPVGILGWITSRSLQIAERILFRYIKVWRPTEPSR